MAILTTNAPNLAFQVPDLQRGTDNLSGGLQALSFGLDKYKLNKERNRFIEAMEEGYKAPGLSGNPQLAAGQAPTPQEQTDGKRLFNDKQLHQILYRKNPEPEEQPEQLTEGSDGKVSEIVKLLLDKKAEKEKQPQPPPDYSLGLSGNPKPQAEASGGERPQIPGLGGLAAQKAMELAAIRARSHGVDTGGYEAMRSRQAQEEAERLALEDKNTMGAFKEFKDMADNNKILRGQYNSANGKYLDYLKENQQVIESNPTIKGEAERLLAAANEAKYKMEIDEQRANEMAKYLVDLGQNRYGFINEAVKNWNNRKDLEKGEIVNPYATELTHTQPNSPTQQIRLK